MKTVRIQKLNTPDGIDMEKWLSDIGDCLRFQPMVVWIGVSYFMMNKENEMVYVYCAKALSFFMTKLRSKVFCVTHVVCNINLVRMEGSCCKRIQKCRSMGSSRASNGY